MGPHLAQLDINLSFWQDLNAHFDVLRSWGCQQLFLSLANLSSANTSTFFPPLTACTGTTEGFSCWLQWSHVFLELSLLRGWCLGCRQMGSAHLSSGCLRDLPGLSLQCNCESCLFYLSFSLITCCSPWGSSGLSCYKFDLEVEIGNRNQRFCDYNKEGTCPKGQVDVVWLRLLIQSWKLKSFSIDIPLDVYKKETTWPFSWRWDSSEKQHMCWCLEK